MNLVAKINPTANLEHPIPAETWMGDLTQGLFAASLDPLPGQ